MARRSADRFQKVARLTKVQLPPGEYPNTWGSDGGAESEYHYLHSSIRGFNADYLSLTKRVNLANVFDNLKKQVYQTSQENVNLLREISQKTRQTIFGATDLSKNVEDDPKISILLHPTKPEHPSYIQAIQNLKSVLNWSDFEDQFIKQLNDDYTKNGTVKHHRGDAEYAAFYQQVGNRIGEALQAFVDSASTVKTQAGDLERAVARAQELLQSAKTQPNYFGNLIINRQFTAEINKDNYAQLLGYAYEDLITAAFLQTLSDIYTDASTQILRIGQDNKLTDTLLKGHPIRIEGRGRFEGAEIDIGISAKLRRQNRFDLTAQVQFSDFTSAIERSGGIEALNALAYIYDNYLALSTWNTSTNTARGTTRYKIQKGGKTQTHLSSFKHRKEALLASNTSLGQFFRPLAEYITMLMLNLSFFGNRLDANNIPMFDETFFQTLDANITSGASTPPAFLFTSQHVYETWKVFQYYLNQANQGHPLFTAADIFNNAFSQSKSPYAANSLINSYRMKRKFLQTAQEGDTIYGRLQDAGIMSFIPQISAFKEMIKADSRTLTTRIKLAASY